MKNTKLLSALLAFALISAVGTACSNTNPTATPTQTETNTSKPTETNTPAPTETATITPTDTSTVAPTDTNTNVPVTYEYVLNKTTIEIDVNETDKLVVYVDPEKEITPTYVSSNSDIASVAQDGTVTGVAEGTVTITVTVDGQELKCQVTVKPLPIEYQYTLSNTELPMEIGETTTLTVSVTPEKEETPQVYWSTSNSEIVEVNSSGVLAAKGVGTATITATVDGQELKCQVTVTSDVVVTNKQVTDIAGQHVDLSAKLDESLETVYWEHYQENGVDNMLNATDLINSNPLNGEDIRWFGDYKATFDWTNGSNITAWGGNTRGLCTGASQEIEITVNENISKLQVYTGAWRATVDASLYYKGVEIAKADSFTAGEEGIARLVEFDLDVEKQSTVTLKITPSNKGDSGNYSLKAITMLGNKVDDNTTSVTMSKTEMMGVNENHINLTEKGTKDWYYLNYEHVADEKNGGNAIKTETLKVESNGTFWDYKAAFNWTDGTEWEKSPIDNDNGDQGTNNGKCGAFVNINVDVDASTSDVYLYIGGWQSSYGVAIVDSTGDIIFNEIVVTHDQVNGGTYAYEVDFAINASVAETLTFIVYKNVNSGGNVSLAAVAVK